MQETGKTINCGYCGGEIYEGEEYGTDGGVIICDECAEGILWRMPLSDKFELLGYTAETLEGTKGRGLDDE